MPLEHAKQWLGELWWRYVESNWFAANLMGEIMIKIDSIEDFLVAYWATE